MAQLHPGIPEHLPRHHFTLPRHQKMWFTLALAKYCVLLLPYYRHTLDIATPYASDTFKRLLSCTLECHEYNTDQGFSLRKIILPHWCRCVTIIRIVHCTLILYGVVAVIQWRSIINSSNACQIYQSCGRLAANILIEVLELCNGAQIYLDKYNVTRRKQDMI